MRLWLIFIVAGLSIASPALAQSIGQGRVAPEPGVACPPDVRGDPPTVGGSSLATSWRNPTELSVPRLDFGCRHAGTPARRRSAQGYTAARQPRRKSECAAEINCLQLGFRSTYLGNHVFASAHAPYSVGTHLQYSRIFGIAFFAIVARRPDTHIQHPIRTECNRAVRMLAGLASRRLCAAPLQANRLD